jgi:hypothetical protein
MGRVRAGSAPTALDGMRIAAGVTVAIHQEQR